MAGRIFCCPLSWSMLGKALILQATAERLKPLAFSVMAGLQLIILETNETGTIANRSWDS
jgi:hypothetical protein